jgi:putative ABC transport system permease protein
LIFLRQQQNKLGIDDIQFSAHEIQDFREQNHSLSGLVEFHGMSFILYGHGDPDRVRTGVVSWNFFDLFGVQPILGRTFQPGDEDPRRSSAAAQLQYWKNNFGADWNILEKPLK